MTTFCAVFLGQVVSDALQQFATHCVGITGTEITHTRRTQTFEHLVNKKGSGKEKFSEEKVKGWFGDVTTRRKGERKSQQYSKHDQYSPSSVELVAFHKSWLQRLSSPRVALGHSVCTLHSISQKTRSKFSWCGSFSSFGSPSRAWSAWTVKCR